MAHSSESGPGHFQQPSRGSSPQSYDLSSPESPQEGSTGSSWYHSQNTVPLLDARTPPTEQAYRNSWFPQNDSSYPSFASPQESQSGHSNYFNHGSKKGPSDSDPSLRPSVSNRYVIPTPTLLYMGPEKDDTLHSAGEPLVGAGKARLLADSTYIRGHKNFLYV